MTQLVEAIRSHNNSKSMALKGFVDSKRVLEILDQEKLRFN